MYHYDIDHDINTNLTQKWDYINEAEFKDKNKHKHQPSITIKQPNYLINKVPIHKQSKSRSKKSVLDEVKTYISSTQERFRKADRSMEQSVKFSDQTF